MKRLFDFSKSGLAWGVAVVLLVMAPAIWCLHRAMAGRSIPNVPTGSGWNSSSLPACLGGPIPDLLCGETRTIIITSSSCSSMTASISLSISSARPHLDQLMDKHQRQGEWPVILNLLVSASASAPRSSKNVNFSAAEYGPGRMGPAVLLVFVAILSSFLDNIAAALIGGTIALVVFKGKVHIGYIAVSSPPPMPAVPVRWSATPPRR